MLTLNIFYRAVSVHKFDTRPLPPCFFFEISCHFVLGSLHTFTFLGRGSFCVIQLLRNVALLRAFSLAFDAWSQTNFHVACIQPSTKRKRFVFLICHVVLRCCAFHLCDFSLFRGVICGHNACHYLISSLPNRGKEER